MINPIDKAFNQLKNVLDSGKLSGSWLICGPYGVGKSTLIKRFVAYLLTGKEDILDYYADLKWIERPLTDEEKKDVAQTLLSGRSLEIPLQDRAKKAEITIDDIRVGIQFLSLTSANKNWRVLVIDTADDMNENAANALLKLLEEPPDKSVIFLISHNYGKLLPTIRSRCRQISILPLSDLLMQDFISKEYPSEENTKVLLPFFSGSIGKAKDFFENDGSNLYRQILTIMEEKNNMEEIFALSEKVSKNENLYNLFKDLLLFIVLEKVKNLDISPAKRKAYMHFWEDTNKLFADGQNLYLDKKAILLETLLNLGQIK